ncbi:MAG: aspartyl/glutamyl-tRNA amidotransferase subunit A [Erysipelotrichaceae bacterium]|nr:aspartyl/glutamyl-tRNA amidotransferase subunit A [Erysipelotrichaceae bacterium]
MKITDCLNRKEAAFRAYEKLLESQKDLNAVITPIAPSGSFSDGKLSGVPIAVKDNVSTKGILTTAGSAILQNNIPVFDATIVERLKREGAVIIAKSSLDELSMGSRNLTSFFGEVHNPHDLSRVPGGSSGGSAALVAAGIVPAAIGSDTGDSVRKPASYCGIIGVKPTYGLISRYGIIPYAASLDTVGYFTTNVKDACRMLEVLAGHDEKDMTSSDHRKENYEEELTSDIRGKKVLIMKDVLDAIKDERIRRLFDNVINILKKRGALVEEVCFDKDLLCAAFPVYYTIANAEAVIHHVNLTGIPSGKKEEGEDYEEIITASRTKGFGHNTKKRFMIGAYALQEENREKVLVKARKIRKQISDMVLKKMESADVLLAPSAPKIAPPIKEKARIETDEEFLIADNHMVIENLSGMPGMSMPMGKVEGMPVGVHIAAKLFDEKTMFSVAKAIEEDSVKMFCE